MLDSKFSIWFSICHYFSNTTIRYMCGYLFVFGPHAGVISDQNYGHPIFSFLNRNVKKKKPKTKQTNKQVKAHPGYHLWLGVNLCTLKEDPQMN